MFSIAFSSPTRAQFWGILRRNITMKAEMCEGLRYLSVTSHCTTRTYVRNIGEDARWKVTSSENEVEVTLFRVYRDNINGGILGALAKLRKATISFVMCLSDRLIAWNMSAPTGQIFTKFYVNVLLWRSVEKNSNLTKIGQE
jgi:hypothetical protein